MDAMFTPLAYGMTGKQVRDIINGNSLALETYSLKESITDNITEGLSYADFIYYVNDKLTRPANSMALDPAEYTELTTETADIVTLINTNYDIVLSQTATFLSDGIPYWFDFKQVKIPGKGVANILSQNESWKFGYFTGETILYISADGGLTWPYSKDFEAGPDNIKYAHIFSDGNVFFAIKQNKIFASYDLLSTIVEETMMDIDGITPITFHVPLYHLYPGMYFGQWIYDGSYILDGKEVLVWGNYPAHVSYGAAPINIYYKKNSPENPRTIYHFGQNSFARDNGQPGGYTTTEEGNLLGDAENPVKCVHVHSVTQRTPNGELWVTVGDWAEYGEVHFLKLIHNAINDSFDISVYDMNSEVQPFRICDLRFYNNGNNIIWGSDQNNKVYKTTYENLTSTNLADHDEKFTTTANIIGMTDYDKCILAYGMSVVPWIIVSVNHGENWYKAPLDRLYAIGGTGYVSRIKNKDSNGYHLFHLTATINTFDAKGSYLMKLKDKII